MKHTNTQPQLLHFANVIRKARTAAGLKQEVAAKQLQINRKTLSGYENGELAGFSISMLFRMSELYGCAITTLFATSHIPFPPASNRAVY